MKSEIKSKAKVNPTYPVLKIRSTEDFDMVVLFSAEKTGTVLYNSKEGKDYYKVGENRADWYEQNFEVFDDEISLKN